MNTPMNNNLDSADTLIRLQGKVNGLIMDLSSLLSKRSEIKATTRMCEVRRYQSKTIFEVCVDAETNGGAAVSFWFELGCENKRWHVAASISRTVTDGQDILEEYPESFPTNIEQLEAVAAQASDWLVNKGKVFDFNGAS